MIAVGADAGYREEDEHGAVGLTTRGLRWYLRDLERRNEAHHREGNRFINRHLMPVMCPRSLRLHAAAICYHRSVIVPRCTPHLAAQRPRRRQEIGGPMQRRPLAPLRSEVFVRRSGTAGGGQGAPAPNLGIDRKRGV